MRFSLGPISSLLATGATLCGGSDWPVDPLLPFGQIESAVSRAARGQGGTAEPLFPAQALTLRTALAMHTRDAAFQLHQEEMTGRIEAGHAADVIVLDRDLLAVPLHEVSATEVELTMVGGRIVHRA